MGKVTNSNFQITELNLTENKYNKTSEMQETTYILKTSIYGLKVNETNKTALCNGVFETKTDKPYGVRALEVIFIIFY